LHPRVPGDSPSARLNSGETSKLDDSALISLREQMRGELERLPPHSVGHAELAARYDLTTAEINERARVAWSKAT
jgi:hypothetical protein